MNLLDTASLVVTPNGYKASKLYSIIPSDGSGDMTFARTGDTATRVNSSGFIETVLANKPRLDYTGSTCPKLLLEPQRTNLLTYSNAFDNVDWVKSQTTISANVIVSPDGTTTADRLIEDSNFNAHSLENLQGGLLGLNCGSIFAKADSSNRYLTLGLSVGSLGATNFVNAVFDLFNGTVTSSRQTGSQTLVSTNIENFGNGWYRCSIVGNMTSSCSLIISLNNTTIAPSISYSRSEYQGNGTSGIYIWGAQLEAGAFATSYIPTTTASVTRNTDSCSKTSATALIGQTEGTMFLDAMHFNNNSFNTLFILTHASGPGSGYIVIDKYSDNKIVCEYNNGSTQAKIISSSTFGTAKIKIAFAYKANDFVAYVNGTQIGVDTSGSTNVAISTIEIPYVPNNSFGGVYSAALWKTRLQNSELATLTSL